MSNHPGDMDDDSAESGSDCTEQRTVVSRAGLGSTGLWQPIPDVIAVCYCNITDCKRGASVQSESTVVEISFNH